MLLVDSKDVEAALYLLYMLGETEKTSGVVQFSPNVDHSSAIQTLLLTMVDAELHLHTHSAVVLQYLETVVR